MQIVGNKFTSEIDSTDVYAEQELECKNPNCTNKGKKEKTKNKVN